MTTKRPPAKLEEGERIARLAMIMRGAGLVHVRLPDGLELVLSPTDLRGAVPAVPPVPLRKPSAKEQLALEREAMREKLRDLYPHLELDDEEIDRRIAAEKGVPR